MKDRADAPHRERPSHAKSRPVHATWRLLPHVWNLRARRCFRVLRKAFAAAAERRGVFRLVHFSVQGNHIHVLVEAADKRSLTNGMRGLAIRIARSLNAVMARRGKALGRYHSRALTTPREVRNALVYVFQNAKKHALQYGRPLPMGWLDPCSSAFWFDGWKDAARAQQAAADAAGSPCVAPARVWLLTTGWRRHGLIGVEELPRAA
jgi:REP element-mobilizing transposase RayT